MSKPINTEKKTTVCTTERPKPAPIGTRTTDSPRELRIVNTNRNGDKR